MSSTPRPNILILMSDEHRYDVAGFAGDSVVRTPTLDWLAETGVVFTNAYTPSPVCIPARQCMMAGQLPKTCGCRNFGEDLEPNYMTFARRFSQYAYLTACAGKMHHHGADQMQGWRERVAPDAHWGTRFVEGKVQEEFDRYKTAMPGTGKWSNQKEIERAAVGYGPWQRFDDRVTQAACDLIDDIYLSPFWDRAMTGQPVLLKHSLIQPHYPYFTDRGKFTYYLNRVPIFQDQQFSDHPVLRRTQYGPDVDATERDLRRCVATYYGMVESIDGHYRTVMDALEHAGQDLDDWIIIYTTDHGEMLGEHAVWEKASFYEGSVKVPLIIRWPKGFEGGRVLDQNVNLCDLFATLCDFADIPTPEGLDSRSLAPLLRGGASDWNNESISQQGLDRVMIKRDALKYQYYGEEAPEVLFDLEADPGEMRDFSQDPKYAKDMDGFRRRLGELGYGPQANENNVNAGY